MKLTGIRRAIVHLQRRGTIELDLPERRVFLDEAGIPVEIRKRVRLASHMLIEELMIAANVAAAEWELSGADLRALAEV